MDAQGNGKASGSAWNQGYPDLSCGFSGGRREDSPDHRDHCCPDHCGDEEAGADQRGGQLSGQPYGQYFKKHSPEGNKGWIV